MGSARKRVLCAGPTHAVAAEILGREVDLVHAEDLGDDELRAVLPTVEGIYTHAPAKVGADWLQAATRLEVIGNAGSGTNRIDMDTATQRRIPVVHAAGAAYQAVAEHAVGLMLSVSKRIAFYDRYFHRERAYPPKAYDELYGRLDGSAMAFGGNQLFRKTVGIVGLGFIGRDVAHKCSAAFAMEVVAFDPYYQIFEARRQGIELVRSLDELLPRCDHLVITCPLNDETRDLIGEAELAQLPASAFVIVVSRGGIVNEQALVAALEQGRIAGAGIDVWDPEPAPEGHALFGMDNVVLTPHVAGGTVEALAQIADAVATQMVQALRGVRPDHLANPEVWPPGDPSPRAGVSPA